MGKLKFFICLIKAAKMTEEAELSNEELAKELAHGLVDLHTDHLTGFADAESFDKTVALLLHQLDEFSALQGMLAEDSALCFDKNVPQILTKLQGLDPICERIDKLEKFVGIMKKQVDEMEKSRSSRKILQVGMTANVKKVFTSFLPRRQNQAPPPTFHPVALGDVDRFFEKPHA